MQKTRVFIVDGDVRSRHFLRNALTSSGNVEIAGSVPNGDMALKKIPMASPDIVFLETEPPNEDAIKTLINIRNSDSDLPVIMLTSKTGNQSAAKILEAFAAGASDYLANTDYINPKPQVREAFNKEITAKIIPFARKGKRPQTQKINSTRNQSSVLSELPQAPFKTESPECGSERVDILVVAVSTGGPTALAKILPRLSADFPVPILIVQHMPKEFTSLLAQRLNMKSKIPVEEARSGETLHPGKVWLAPGGKHLSVYSDRSHMRLITTLDPPENSCRPAADVLFRSVAKFYGPHTLALVLTGMGQDGLEGCRRIHEAGGKVIAQDETTSVVWGMPGALVQSQLADQVMPLNKIADEVTKRVWMKRSNPYASQQLH